MSTLLSIDTGTVESAYVVVDTETYKIVKDAFDVPICGMISNEEMLQLCRTGYYDVCVVEMFSSYGARVGKEVFESVVMIGQCLEACYPQPAYRIPRRKVKEYICGRGSGVKDADVIQALKDRFGSKGTKTKPGFFFGTKADIWQSFALATAYIDMRKDGVTDFE